MKLRLPPLLVEGLAKREYPLKYSLFRLLRAAGFLKLELTFRLGDGELYAPADEWNFWRLRDVARYDPDLTTLCRFVNERIGEFDLLDLGADIGMVSRFVHSECPGLRSVTAVEPNPFSFAYLERNLRTLPIPAKALKMAVSDFTGLARLEFDPMRQSDHAGHIEVGEAGDNMVAVETVDRIFVPRARDLVMKIDVEGEERAVCGGAQETVQRAERVVLFMEVHPDVIRRTGGSAEELFEAAEAIRPCEWFLSDPGMPRVDRRRHFFQQFPQVRQHDVIGFMEPRPLSR
ncbi:MAG TPA: FkbM family methyltransferase [Roseomonas sp.]|jgi:FkbM family methyltransferase